MDRTNSFSFGMSPFGVQREGLVVNGGAQSDDLSLSWDNKWVGESKMYEDFWVQPKSMQSALYQAARKRKLKVKTHLPNTDDSVYIQVVNT
jgi:hypothetical protein